MSAHNFLTSCTELGSFCSSTLSVVYYSLKLHLEQVLWEVESTRYAITSSPRCDHSQLNCHDYDISSCCRLVDVHWTELCHLVEMHHNSVPLYTALLLSDTFSTCKIKYLASDLKWWFLSFHSACRSSHLSISVSLFLWIIPGICIIAHSLRTNACALLWVWLCRRSTCVSHSGLTYPRREAAFCICMALSGVTCSPPPPPSATIEAIEALEPHDEDREGKPALHLPPPLSTYGSGFPATEDKCHN